MADGINKFAEYLKTRNSFARVRNAEKAIAAFRALPTNVGSAHSQALKDESRSISNKTAAYNLGQKKIIDPIKIDAAKTTRDRAEFQLSEDKLNAPIKRETAKIKNEIAELQKEALTAPAQKPQKAYFRGFEFEVDPSGGINFSKDEVARDKYDQNVISKTVGAGTYSLVAEGSTRTIEDQVPAFTYLEIEKAGAARYDRMLSIEAMNVAREIGVSPEFAHKQLEKTVEYAKIYQDVVGSLKGTILGGGADFNLDRELAYRAMDAGFDVDEFGDFIYGGEEGKLGSYGLRDALKYADFSLNTLGR